MKRLFFYFLVLCISSVSPVLAGTQGKIKGKVVDSKTGELLIGASVVVVGTSFGATTNIEGEYNILRIEAGTYTLKASFIGYQSITVSNIKVNADLTSDANFRLPLEGVVGQEVVIVAERPLINKSATNAVRIVDAASIENLPTRGIDAVIRSVPGVIQRGTDTYIRGSRSDQTGFTIEGVSVTNMLSGGRAVGVTDDAIEEIQVQSGGYPAEFPGANGGIVSASLKSGGERLKISLKTETDNYTAQNKKSLGGYSYGYSDYTLTVGGPVPELEKMRYFVSYENTFYRDPNIRFLDEINFSGANALIASATRSAAHPNIATITDTINFIYPGGNFVGGMNNQHQFNGTLLYNLGDIQIKGSGSYAMQESRTTASYANILNQSRLPLNKNQNGFEQIKVTHFITPKISYEASGSYTFRYTQSMDPQLLNNFEAYGDTAANRKLGYNNYYFSSTVNQWIPFSAWNFMDGTLAINQPGTRIAGYLKEAQQKFSGKIDFTAQFNEHAVKIGGEYTLGTVRQFNPPGLDTRFTTLHDSSLTLAEKEKKLRENGTGNYGYDIYGKAIDNDVYSADGRLLDLGARKPVTVGIYLQDKIELSDLNINVGARYDYLDNDNIDFVNPKSIVQDTVTNLISSSSIVKTPVTKQLSPRIGFSFPVTERTTFHAQYGQFISPTRGNDSYRSISNISGQIFTAGFFYPSPVGFGLRPERSTLYEVGFEQQLGENSSFDITTYYKDIQDQVTFIQVSPQAGAGHGIYQSLTNQDFATTKGVEFKFTLRRTNRMEVNFNYTYSDARATGTGPLSLSGTVGGSVDPNFTPKFIFPTENNQAHRGSATIDYRFPKNDGGMILERSGLNLLFSFNSGYSYTRLQIDGPGVGDGRFRIPLELLGSSSTPWYFRLDAKLNKTVTIGPLDLDVFIRVTNVLNAENAIAVYPRTGDAKDDGWLSTVDGNKKAAGLGSQYVALYHALTGGVNSGLFDAPRQIVFGIKLVY